MKVEVDGNDEELLCFGFLLQYYDMYRRIILLRDSVHIIRFMFLLAACFCGPKIYEKRTLFILYFNYIYFTI